MTRCASTNVEGSCRCRGGRRRGTASTNRRPVERIRFARRLQQLGLTLDEVIDALHASDRGGISCDSERWRLEAVLERIDTKMAALRAARREVKAVMSACDRGACVFGADPPSSGHAVS